VRKIGCTTYKEIDVQDRVQVRGEELFVESVSRIERLDLHVPDEPYININGKKHESVEIPIVTPRRPSSPPSSKKGSKVNSQAHPLAGTSFALLSIAFFNFSQSPNAPTTSAVRSGLAFSVFPPLPESGASEEK
jgi:hypothetical protein